MRMMNTAKPLAKFSAMLGFFEMSLIKAMPELILPDVSPQLSPSY